MFSGSFRLFKLARLTYVQAAQQPIEHLSATGVVLRAGTYDSTARTRTIYKRAALLETVKACGIVNLLRAASRKKEREKFDGS